MIGHGAGAQEEPGWLLRIAAPFIGSVVTGTSMRVATAKAKTELGGQPAFPTYHEGIQAMAGLTPARL